MMLARSILLLSALAMCAMSVGQGEFKQRVVCIDPGHPSEVGNGTRGKLVTEMQVNFHVARLLAKRLESEGFKVVMTKNDVNRLITNRRRAEIANWAHADLFVRLHCDASTGSGYAVYFPGAPGVARDGTTGPSQHVINASGAAARKFHAAMAASLKDELPDLGVKTDAETSVGGKQGALTGSIFSQVPTVLVEMLVLTNKHDEAWILNGKNPPKMAEALDRAIVAALAPPQ